MALIGSVNNQGSLQGQINDANGYLTGFISSAEYMGGQVVGMRGLKGDKGDTGSTGANGQDGYSPTATVTKAGGTATITITDKNGTTTAQVHDGSGGGAGLFVAEYSVTSFADVYDAHNNGYDIVCRFDRESDTIYAPLSGWNGEDSYLFNTIIDHLEYYIVLEENGWGFATYPYADISTATTTTNGLMSSSDKSHLDTVYAQTYPEVVYVAYGDETYSEIVGFYNEGKQVIITYTGSLYKEYYTLCEYNRGDGTYIWNFVTGNTEKRVMLSPTNGGTWSMSTFDNVFCAEYGTTTYTQVLNALNNGQTIRVHRQDPLGLDEYLPFTYWNDDDETFYFNLVLDRVETRVTLTNTNGGTWDRTEKYYAGFFIAEHGETDYDDIYNAIVNGDMVICQFPIGDTASGYAYVYAVDETNDPPNGIYFSATMSAGSASCDVYSFNVKKNPAPALTTSWSQVESSQTVTSYDITTWYAKQDKLVSGTNIKTINNTSLLGSGNITISGGGGTSDYDQLSNRPSINSVTLTGNKTASDLSLASASHTHTVSDVTDFPTIPSATSDLLNDSGFITNSDIPLFDAIYNTTTYQQVYDAYDDGEQILCHLRDPDDSSRVYFLPMVGQGNNFFTFSTVIGSTQHIAELASVGGWDYYTQPVSSITDVKVNNVSVVDDDVALITVPTEVYWATYNTTTSANIETAYQANQVVCVLYQSKVYTLRYRNSSTDHRFICNYGDTEYRLRCVSNVWSTETTTFVKTTRTINGKALSNDITLSASDVGALSSSTAIPSKVSDLSNDSGFITTETDPTVPSWAKAVSKPSYSFSELQSTPTTLSGYGITDAKISSGTITLGGSTITPLTSFTESDPIFTSSPAYGISASDISNWNGKNAVSVSRYTTSGTNIADITIDGSTTKLYAPTSGGVSGTLVQLVRW